jgi:hypothetical protein
VERSADGVTFVFSANPSLLGLHHPDVKKFLCDRFDSSKRNFLNPYRATVSQNSLVMCSSLRFTAEWRTEESSFMMLNYRLAQKLWILAFVIVITARMRVA